MVLNSLSGPVCLSSPEWGAAASTHGLDLRARLFVRDLVHRAESKDPLDLQLEKYPPPLTLPFIQPSLAIPKNTLGAGLKAHLWSSETERKP